MASLATSLFGSPAKVSGTRADISSMTETMQPAGATFIETPGMVHNAKVIAKALLVGLAVVGVIAIKTGESPIVLHQKPVAVIQSVQPSPVPSSPVKAGEPAGK